MNVSTSQIKIARNQGGQEFQFFNANDGVWESNGFLDFEFEVPIAEWVGSGTVNLGQNDVEYLSNSGMGDTDDTTSFVYGPAGSPIPQVNYSATRSKRIQLLTPLQQGESLVFQVDLDGAGQWFTPTTKTFATDGNSLTQQGFEQQNTNVYGMGKILEVSGNPLQYDVQFGPYRVASGATYGAAGANWTTSSARWRVVKSVAGQAVGFGLASSTASGLAPSGVFSSGETQVIDLQPRSTNPANPTSSSDVKVYVKGSLYILMYNDAGTVRFKYLDMTGTGVTWVHTTTPP